MVYAETPPRWGILCAPCHGEAGYGDGRAADLYWPRPRNLVTGRLLYGDDSVGLARTIREGLPTGMPAFGNALSKTEIAGLAEFILTQRERNPVTPSRVRGTRTQESERRTSLSATACQNCHPLQARQWQASLHARAMGPGVIGQYHLMSQPDVRRCNRCHSPAASDARSTNTGVDCIGCHLDGQTLLASSAGPHPPINGVALQRTSARRIERSDMCAPCHNLPLATAVNGRPLLDTWREWAASPWLPRGTQCQDCHLAETGHAFHGAHNPERVRAAVRMQVTSTSTRDRVLRLEIAVSNVGAGHHFPTTATPRATLSIAQYQENGEQPANENLWVIARDVEAIDGRWVEHFDTRIPAETTQRFVDRQEVVPGLDRVVVTLRFFPDWHYSGLYRELLGRGLPTVTRGMLDEARRAADGSDFVVHQETLHFAASGSDTSKGGSFRTGPGVR